MWGIYAFLPLHPRRFNDKYNTRYIGQHTQEILPDLPYPCLCPRVGILRTRETLKIITILR